MYKILVSDDPERKTSIFLCKSVFSLKVNNEYIPAMNAENIGNPYRIVERSIGCIHLIACST